MSGVASILLLRLVLAFLASCCCFIAVAEGRVLCREEEMHALLDFKLSFTAPSGALSDWNISNLECCGWNGVFGCDDRTGHVTKIDLFGESLEGHELRSSLLVLHHLKSLVLSGNSFSMRIPEFIGSFTKLTNLDLSYSGFFGEIPPHLGNLTSLQILRLGDSSLGLLHANNLQWLSQLSSLKTLHLSGVNLSNATDWLSSLKMLPSLSELYCSSCSLPYVLPHVSSQCLQNHSTSLETLFLSHNNISPMAFSCLTNGSVNLIYLDLAYGTLEQNMHEYLEASMMQNLQFLDISYNLMSTLPDLSKFSSLSYLDSSNNRMNGSLHAILQHLPQNLTHLDLSANSINDIISDSHFSHFSKLENLDLSGNYLLTFNCSRSWVPPFQLTELQLSSCKLGPAFPNWILTQIQLGRLDLSNSSIFGALPGGFWNWSTNLVFLNVSHNKLQGTLPKLSVGLPRYSDIDLSSNEFHGPVPFFMFSAVILDLSNNNFSSFPSLHHESPNHRSFLINLSNNKLSATILDWIYQFDGLRVLNLAFNKLSGTIPRIIAALWNIRALHLNNNRLSGELPSSMENCTQLLILELGNNNFTGNVPFWLGDNLLQLIVLSLRSNNFSGDLPSNLCHLQRLQVLDLSGNRISGSIPSCINNFTSMTTYQAINVSTQEFMFSITLPTINDGGFLELIDSASIMWKGTMENESGINHLQLNVIDLSNNCLTGKIPSGVTSLNYLRSLEISRNNLNGSIPAKIGELKYLEVLKVSSNTLGGELPQSLADLTFLNTLNVSSNNLSGRIPSRTQLQSFDPSSYAGNPKLCGEPLPTMCPGDEPPPVRGYKEEDEEVDNKTFDFEALYAALGAGFACGLFGILGILHFHARSRHAFFHMASEVGDWIFVRTSLCQSRIRRRIHIIRQSDAADI